MAGPEGLTVCVVDGGLFLGLASLLKRKGWGTVYYCNYWKSSYPSSMQHDVGEGYEGVEVVDDVWSLIAKDFPRVLDPKEHDDEGFLYEPAVDLIVVTDLYFAAETDVLRGLGYRVWGASKSEDLEIDRIESKKILASKGIRLGKYDVVTGIDKLSDYLKSKPGRYYIKGSKTRADFESQESRSYGYIQQWLKEEIPERLGKRAHTFDFVVEKAIEGATEAAMDAYCIDGEFPEQCLLGIEQKGDAYVGHFTDKLPHVFTKTNQWLSGWLKANRCRSFMSIETLITDDGKAYPTDPCQRLGLPSGPSQCMMYKNLSEILWEGAEGEVVEPEPAGKYVAELVLQSKTHRWQRVAIPKEIEDKVWLVNSCRIDGVHYVMPQPSIGPPSGFSTLGTVVCVGKSFEEATAGAIEYEEMIEAGSNGLELSKGAFDSIEEKFEHMKEIGIPLD